MKTNDILSRFQSNNSKLESVLYKKKLSGDVKNLLLNMLYRITTSYNDYASVKVNVEDKNEFVQNMIQTIENCESIELIKPNSEEGKEWIKQGITSKVDTYFKTIKVFPTERDMLFALCKINDKKMYLDEKYHLLRIALPEMLDEGRDINNVELIRDFDAWSWNTIPSEISNIDCNLIYQNLQILLGFSFLDSWMKMEKQKELLEKLEQELKRNYAQENVNELLDAIYRLSILVCISRNENEKKRLLEEREWNEKELARLSDKTKLVEELTKTKKKKRAEIKKIDTIINDSGLLLKEFNKRNEKLSIYKKIYSPEVLLGTLKKERKKALKEIEECNQLLDAKNYVERKNQLEEELNLLKDIKRPKNKEKYKRKIQDIFMRCFEEKIQNIETIEQKKEAISLLRVLRYYHFMIYDEHRMIKEVEEFQEKLDELDAKILLKLYEIKGIVPITKNLETDIGIIKPIFETRIMSLENIAIWVANQNDKIVVKVYDGNTIELEFTIKNLNQVEIKGKKKIKLFGK